MRSREFIQENVSTVSGSMAPVAMPLGSTITRTEKPKMAKYRNSAPEVKRKKDAHR